MRRRTWIYIAAMLGLVAVLYVGGNYLLKRRALRWRDEGFVAASRGDYTSAADLLARFLRRYSGETRALREYIRVRELAELPNGQHLTETISAIQLLINAEHQQDQRNHENPIVTQKQDVRSQHHLLSLYMRLGRHPEALDTAKSALTTVNTLLAAGQSDAELLWLRSDIFKFEVEALRLMHQEREAMTVARDQWIKAEPLDLDAQLAYLALRVAIGQPADLIVQDAQAGLRSHPGDARFELLLAAAYAARSRDHDDIDRATDVLEKASAHPDLTDSFVKALVVQYDAIGRPDQSVHVLEAQARHGGVEIRHLLGRRYWEQGNWSGAADMLSDVDAKGSQSDATLLALRAIALTNAGQRGPAGELRTALATRGNQLSAKAWTLLLARILDAQGSDERPLLEACMNAVRFQPDDPYLDFYLGDCAQRLGEDEIAIAAWQQSVAADPTWITPSARLVDALLQSGRTQQAAQYAVFGQRTRTVAAAIMMARAMSSDSEQRQLSGVDELLGKLQAVERALPHQEQIQLALFKTLAQKGDIAAATKAAGELLSRKPSVDLSTMFALYAGSAKHQLGLQEQIIAAAERAFGPIPPVAYLKAIHLYRSGQSEQALKMLDERVASSTANDPSWKLVRASFLDVISDPRATKVWAGLGDAFPKNLIVQRAIVQARASYRDFQFMTRTIERLRALTDERSLQWQLTRARLLVDFGRNESDRNDGALLLNKLVQRFPQDPQVHVLLAHALARIGYSDAAIEHLTTASRLNPADVSVAIQLASLLQSAGQYNRVLAELDELIPQLNSASQRQSAAMLLAGQNQLEKAEAVLEKAGPAAKDDLLLASLYLRGGQFSKAEQIVNRRMSPPDLDTVRFAVGLYLSRDRQADAELALEKLDELELPPGTALLAKADFAACIGNFARAVDLLETASRKAPSNALVWRELVSGQIRLGKIDDAMATLRAGAGAVPTDNALGLLQKQLGLLHAAAAEPETRAVVLAALRDPANVEASLQLLSVLQDTSQFLDNARLASRFQQLADRYPGSLLCQLQLAKAYLQAGRNTDAMIVAQRAMNTFAADAEPARVVVDVAAAPNVRTDQPMWKQMLEAAQKWRQRAPSQSVAADLAAARAQNGLALYAAAIAQLQPYLPLAQANPDKFEEILAVYSHALVNGGNVNDAGGLLWPIAQVKPVGRRVWIRTAAEIGDESVARAWLERVASLVPKNEQTQRLALARAYDTLAERTGNTDLAEKATVIYADLTGEPSVTAQSLLCAAYRAERHNGLGLAESLYRRTIALDPTLVIARNNLAMLLARRGEVTEAEPLAAACIGAMPRAAGFRDTLAFVKNQAHDPAGAAKIEQAAIELEPENLEWRIRQLKYLLDAGDRDRASQALKSLDTNRLDLREADPELQRQFRDLQQRILLTRDN